MQWNWNITSRPQMFLSLCLIKSVLSRVQKMFLASGWGGGGHYQPHLMDVGCWFAQSALCRLDTLHIPAPDYNKLLSRFRPCKWWDHYKKLPVNTFTYMYKCILGYVVRTSVVYTVGVKTWFNDMKRLCIMYHVYVPACSVCRYFFLYYSN